MRISKKLPIDYECLIMNHDLVDQLSHEFGKDINDLGKSSNASSRACGFFSFVDNKIAKLKFPKKTVSEVGYEFQLKRYGKGYATNKFFWEKQSIIELPISYDSSKDRDAFDEKRNSFLRKMKEMGNSVKPEWEANIDFGPIEFGWINEFLAFMYEKYKPYYINGALPIFEEFRDECRWIEKDPQNPRYKKEISYPYPKSYFISDIERYIEADYDLDMSKFYEWVLENEFVEGRHWESYYEWVPQFTSFRETKCSKTIGDALHLMKIDLDLEKGDNGEYIPLFIDYYKDVDTL